MHIWRKRTARSYLGQPLRLCVFALNLNKPGNRAEARAGHQFWGARPQGRDSSRSQWSARGNQIL